MRAPKEAYLLDSIYIDTGCEHSPACLTCPLPVCKHDARTPSARAIERRQKAKDLYEAGSTPSQVARELGISLRQAHRLK